MDLNKVAVTVIPENLPEHPRCIEFMDSAPFKNSVATVMTFATPQALCDILWSVYMLGYIVGLLHPEERAGIAKVIRVAPVADLGRRGIN
jgi:hypothetical protein